MKIITINSSCNSNGNTATLLNSALEGAKASGADTEAINLNDYQIDYCIGCMKCVSEGLCPLQDDFNIIKEKISKADGIIWGSPTYMNTCNAKMMTLFERFGVFEFMTSDIFGGKYFAAITTASGRAGRTLKVINSLPGIFTRNYISGNHALCVGNLRAVDYKSSLKKSHEIGEKICKDIINKKKFPLQNILSRLITIFLIRPNIKRSIIKNEDYQFSAVYDYHKKKGNI